MTGEQHAAFRAASVIYAKRVCGMSPPCDTFYHGDFDIAAVANAADLPLDSSEWAHRNAWQKFRKLFNEEWQSVPHGTFQ